MVKLTGLLTDKKAAAIEAKEKQLAELVAEVKALKAKIDRLYRQGLNPDQAMRLGGVSVFRLGGGFHPIDYKDTGIHNQTNRRSCDEARVGRYGQ